MKFKISRQISNNNNNNNNNMKSANNPSSGSRVVPCGLVDMMQLIVAFRNFAKTPNNSGVHHANTPILRVLFLEEKLLIKFQFPCVLDTSGSSYFHTLLVCM